MNTLFLDFDGVLFDTLKEAYLLCRYVFYKIDVRLPIEPDKYARFYKFKYLVNNSWQYYYLMKCLSKDLSDNKLIKEYNNYLLDRDLVSEKIFDKDYYAIRETLKTTMQDFWISLEEPFEFFFNVKTLFEKRKFDVVIVSRKDFSSIKFRLNQYGLEINDNNIYGKEQLESYSTKGQFLKEYINNNSISRAIFVDDNSKNLLSCQNIVNLKCFLAGWGNIGILEKGLSSSEIINEIKLL